MTPEAVGVAQLVPATPQPKGGTQKSTACAARATWGAGPRRRMGEGCAAARRGPAGAGGGRRGAAACAEMSGYARPLVL